MAKKGRKKKNISLEDQLDGLREQSESYEDQIREITVSKQAVDESIKEVVKQILYQAMVESAVSVEEAVSLIKKQGSNGEHTKVDSSNSDEEVGEDDLEDDSFDSDEEVELEER